MSVSLFFPFLSVLIMAEKDAPFSSVSWMVFEYDTDVWGEEFLESFSSFERASAWIEAQKRMYDDLTKISRTKWSFRGSSRMKIKKYILDAPVVADQKFASQMAAMPLDIDGSDIDESD